MVSTNIHRRISQNHIPVFNRNTRTLLCKAARSCIADAIYHRISIGLRACQVDISIGIYHQACRTGTKACYLISAQASGRRGNGRRCCRTRTTTERSCVGKSRNHRRIRKFKSHACLFATSAQRNSIGNGISTYRTGCQVYLTCTGINYQIRT